MNIFFAKHIFFKNVIFSNKKNALLIGTTYLGFLYVLFAFDKIAIAINMLEIRLILILISVIGLCFSYLALIEENINSFREFSLGDEVIVFEKHSHIFQPKTISIITPSKFFFKDGSCHDRKSTIVFLDHSKNDNYKNKYLPLYLQNYIVTDFNGGEIVDIIPHYLYCLALVKYENKYEILDFKFSIKNGMIIK